MNSNDFKLYTDSINVCRMTYIKSIKPHRGVSEVCG